MRRKKLRILREVIKLMKRKPRIAREETSHKGSWIRCVACGYRVMLNVKYILKPRLPAAYHVNCPKRPNSPMYYE